jgi:hypothetical protein
MVFSATFNKDSSLRFGAISKAMKIVKKTTDDPEIPVTVWRHMLAQYFHFVEKER